MGVLDVSKANIIKLIQPGNVNDQLTEILRNGARALLAQAVEAELADFLGKHAVLRTAEGHQLAAPLHDPIEGLPVQQDGARDGLQTA